MTDPISDRRFVFKLGPDAADVADKIVATDPVAPQDRGSR